MKPLPIIVMTTILFLSILTIISPKIDAQEILTVGPGGPPIYDFSKITDAITSANENDIIHVYNGTYTENIVINKSITVNGDSGCTILISANSNKNTIELSVNYTNISGFTIKNLGGSYACIQLNSVSSCQISNNHIENGENSIYLINSNNNIIKDNTIENNKNGIYLWTSNNNTIRNNNIQKNEIYGIFISSFSSGNTVYLNDFSNNFGNNSRDDGNNNWNYSSQGNYWDDYNDYDVNPKDGIGDKPYLISGSGGNQDNFPLGDFLSTSQPVAYIDYISPNPSPKGQSISFNGHGTSPYGPIDAYEWRSDNIIISSSASFSKSGFSSGIHNISFRVKDNLGTWSEKDYEILIINPNQKPIAYILTPSGSAEFGKTINFSGYGIDPDGEIKGYMWRSIPSFISRTEASFTMSNLPVENYTIYLKVKDNEGEWSTEVSTTLRIMENTTASNKPPTADAKGPYIGLVNQSITFDGSSSFDPDTEDALHYQLDFGDGSTAEGVIIGHTYNTAGNYSVELTVTDEHGLQSKNSTHATVSMETNGKNNDKGENKDIPGFELIYVLLTISFLLILRKINNKKKGIN